MSEFLIRVGGRFVRLPDGEAKGLRYVDIPNGPNGIVAQVDDKFYLLKDDCTVEEIKI